MEPLEQSSEEMKEERLCGPCKDDGEIIVGVEFCLDCKEILCKSCTKVHKNLKLAKGHKLMDVREMTADVNYADVIANGGKCEVHPDRDVDVYCKTHDCVICALCSCFQHKTCDISEVVSNDIDATKLQTDIQSLITQMKAALEHVDSLQKAKKNIKANFKQNLSEIRETIETVREQVVELMDNVVAHVTDITKQIELKRGDDIDVDTGGVEEIRELVEQKVALLQTIDQHGSKKQKFVSAHLVKKQYEEIIAQISQEDKLVEHLDAELILEDTLQKLLEAPEIEKMVHIRVTESNRRLPASVSAPSVDTGTDHESIFLRDSRLAKIEEHRLPSDTGRPPNYSGVAVYKDGRVFVSDDSSWFTFVPGLLHMFNPADRTQLTLKLTDAPSSATQIDDTHLAVCVPGNKSISIVSVGDELRMERTFYIQEEPYTIVALTNGHLAVAWRNPPSFSVIDISGAEIVQKSYMDQDRTGRKFKSFQYLAVDEKRQHVIQPCNTDKAVYCFDLKGKPVFKYKHPGLTNPRGVAFDRCGNIYVCEYKNSSIHKLSPTGDPISVITEDVPSGPKAICCDANGTGFWVTSNS